MRVRNLTPYAHLLYANEDAQARLFDVLIVKQSFGLTDDLSLLPAIEQEPLNFTDACYEDFNTSSLRYPSDLVPYKPVTDVIVTAAAHAPSGEPVADWTCGLSVSGPSGLDKRLRVTGPRQWERRLRGWVLSAPEPVAMLPLRYEYAYGGEIIRDEDDITTDERNPLGRGLFDGKSDGPHPAPQIEAAEQPVTDPERRYQPQGLGPIPPAWLPRRPLGGTYDAHWVENVWPHWAADYDFAFHNSAGLGMKAKGYLKGDETITFTNLRPGVPEFSIDLPGETVLAHLVGAEGGRRMVALNLDTVYIDLLPEDPEDCLIALTWRLAFLDAGLSWIEIDSSVVANPIRMWGAGNGIEEAPHPSALFKEKELADVE